MQVVLHIHFNDHRRKNKWATGKYRGFAIYVPSEKMINYTESVSLAQNIFDFLESLSSHTSSGGYLLFDFIQNISVGEVEVAKPVDTKNEFTIAQIDEIMGRFGFDRIDNNGDETRRVRVVCYQKRSVS
jgi:hypothetical protein